MSTRSLEAAQSRDTVLELLETLAAGELDRATLQKALAHAERVERKEPDPQSRSGLVMQAPTVWHAACFLLVAHHRSGARDDSRAKDDPQLFDTFYGNRPLYRGQARPWPILPSLWRVESASLRSLGASPLRAFQKFIQQWTQRAKDVGFELWGGLESLSAATAVAQHYGFPTTFIDLTFDPLVALHFACRTCRDSGESLALNERHQAAIYSTSFAKLLTLEALTDSAAVAHLPPIQVQRLYNQAGLFHDPGAGRDRCNYLEENCSRLQFPRTYPDFDEARELVNDALETDERFFSEPLAMLKSYCEAAGAQFSESEATSSMIASSRSGPPWLLEEDLGSLITTDKYLADVALGLARYLFRCCRVSVGTEGLLDPLVLSSLARSNPAPFAALRGIASTSGEASERLRVTLGAIQESLEIADSLRT